MKYTSILKVKYNDVGILRESISSPQYRWARSVSLAFKEDCSFSDFSECLFSEFSENEQSSLKARLTDLAHLYCVEEINSRDFAFHGECFRAVVLNLSSLEAHFQCQKKY